MNDAHEDIQVAVELDATLPVLPPEIKLLADLLPELIKDILSMQADTEG